MHAKDDIEYWYYWRCSCGEHSSSPTTWRSAQFEALTHKDKRVDHRVSIGPVGEEPDKWPIKPTTDRELSC